ncbi:transposase [Peptacetobacter hominis]|uniref:transposase n=1 Tax=Peptacetobacter hominis TaxID=2743610 RepID=UPI0038CD726D
MVHQVRNTPKYISYKDKKEFASDLKSIYHAVNEEHVKINLEHIAERLNEKHPNAIKLWFTN